MDRIQVLAESGGIPVENVRFIWNLALEEAAKVAEKDEQHYNECVRICERNEDEDEFDWDAYMNKSTAARRIKEAIRALTDEK